MTENAIRFNDFYIDLPCSEPDRLFVDACGFTTVIVLTDEGIVVDIYPVTIADESIASTWASYSDLPPPEGEQR